MSNYGYGGYSSPTPSPYFPNGQIDKPISYSGHFEFNFAAVLKTIIFGSVTIGTIFGNGLVLLVMILKRRTLNSSTHYFIASLSLADFFVGLLVMPYLSILSITEKWYFGQGACMLFHSTHYWLCSASIFSIAAICVERYVGVRYPLQHYKLVNPMRVLKICIFVWIIAGILGVVPLFIWPEKFPEDPYVCPINFRLPHVLIVMLVIFYLPCLIMIFFYWRIYKIASAHLSSTSKERQRTAEVISKNTSKSETSYNVESISENSQSTESEELITGGEMVEKKRPNNEKKKTLPHGKQQKSNEDRQTKLAKKLAFVVGAFFFSYFPFFTAFFIKSFDNSLVPDQFFILLGWIRYGNSGLNPIIYAVTLKPFRDAFKEVFNKILRK